MADRAEEVRRVLDAVDAVAADEPPAEQARQLAAAWDEARDRFRWRRQQAVRRMHESGMTYRQIAAELDISFGRVRQILAEELEPPAEQP
jgi:DNA-directed RNA polymerase specialized sigma24 family protein